MFNVWGGISLFLFPFPISNSLSLFSVQNKNHSKDINTVIYVLVMDQGKVNVNILMGEINDGTKSHKCDQCDFSSSQRGDLRKHLKEHCEKKSHQCSQCDYSSSRAGNLRTHLRIHTGEKSNKCSQCDYASCDASNLRTHLKTHSGEKQMQNVNLYPLRQVI